MKVKRFVIPLVVSLLVLVVGAIYNFTIKPMTHYQDAQEFLRLGNLDAAEAAFIKSGDYKNSLDLRKEIPMMRAYAQAEGFLNEGNIEAAVDAFVALNDYRDAKMRLLAIPEYKHYNLATQQIESDDYRNAITTLEACLDYKDSKERLYLLGKKLATLGNQQLASEAFKRLGNYKDSTDRLKAVQQGNKMTLTPDQRYEINHFLNTLTRARLVDFVVIPSAKDLIDFAVLNTQIFHADEIQYSGNDYYIHTSAIDARLRTLLGVTVQHQSTPSNGFDGDNYSGAISFPMYIEGPNALVSEVYRSENDNFKVIFYTLAAPEAVDLDLTPEAFKEKMRLYPTDYAIVAEKEAHLKLVTLDGNKYFQIVSLRTIN